MEKIAYFIEAWEMNGVGKTVATVQDSPGTVVTITVDDLRALLARQPAAIDTEAVALSAEQEREAFNVWFETSRSLPLGSATARAMWEAWHARAALSAPLAKEASKPDGAPDPSDIQGWSVTINVNAQDILTIADNCVSGIDNIEDFAPVVRNCAEHLLSFIGATPSVEQDERGALEAAYNAGWDASDACDNAYNNGTSEQLLVPGQSHEPEVFQRWRAEWFSNRDEVITQLLKARAASTSANVAQGAEAVAWRWEVEVLGVKTWQYASHWSTGPKDAQPLYTAPPAQTAITDQQLADIRRAAVVIRENSYPCPDKPHSNWALADRIEKVIAALTAAQSASGETK